MITTISAKELREHIHFEDLVEPVSTAFQEFSSGLATSEFIKMYPVDPPENGDVYVKTGTIKGHSIYIVKISPWFAANIEQNEPQGGFIAVFDSQTGHTIALLSDEHYLSDIRTAAAGVLAARTLSRQSVQVAGVLGTGVQAYWQSLALAEARSFETLLLWGRNSQKALQLKERLQQRMNNIEIRIVDTAEEAVRSSDVLVTATQAREPIVNGEWLHPGQHITAVGADDHTKCELDAECLQRANRLIVDSIVSAQENGETYRWLQNGDITMDSIHGEIGAVLAGSIPGRQSDDEITIAKFVGLGVQDLAAAEVAIGKMKLTNRPDLTGFNY